MVEIDPWLSRARVEEEEGVEGLDVCAKHRQVSRCAIGQPEGG